MSEELKHECGVAALYWMGESHGPNGQAGRSVHNDDVVALMPSMLLDIQNRGQLAAGFSSYNADRSQILDTYKDIGTVAEAFRMSHPAKHVAILEEYAGRAAIGHTRYATCGQDDARYAQPFERHHGRLWKWFSFAFNGQLSNYADLRDRLLQRRNYHFTLDTDTEIIMHLLAYRLRGDKLPNLREVMKSLSRHFDGAYDLVFLDAMGRMFVARDPLGLRPMCWSVQGRFFAAANESVALTNMGFTEIHDLAPGKMIIIEKGKLRVERFAKSVQKAHCFFEWAYFSNVASVIDSSNVYIARANLGRRLAELEDQEIDDSCIVVPVPDTAKAAGDAYAFKMGIQSVEGLMRNRYVGRTFIQSGNTRSRSVKSKYTALKDVLCGKRVFLVEDSIVRSTTLKRLVGQIRKQGKAKEIHVRVACPPIVAPCFYGIDMSTVEELFAPKFIPRKYNGSPSEKTMAEMARTLKVDSLRYLSVDDLGPCLQIPNESLCTGCVTGKYPSLWGNKLMARAKRNRKSRRNGRTYE